VTASTATVKDRSTGTRKVLAAILAFALVSVFVIRTSNAAFTAETDNEGNLFELATIALDTDLEIPLFGEGSPASLVDATGMYPGYTVDGCINVDFSDTSGNLTAADLAAVELAITGAQGDINIDPQDFTVEVQVFDDACGVGNLDTTLNGDLAGLASANTGWTPSGNGDVAGFHFYVTLDESLADNDAQGQRVDNVNLVWSVSTN
jgi:hypothetical protein